MQISTLPSRLVRYKDIALLLIKHGRRDLVQEAGLLEDLNDNDSADTDAKQAASELAEDLERLGPTFVKLGQLLSTRPDLLPQLYLDALSRLQDDVEPFPFTEVEEIVSSELGVRISKAFSEFETKPLAAASVAQVHRAKLRDGRAVVVKVQRPGIRHQVAQDLEIFTEVAELLDRHTEVGRRFRFSLLVEEFRKSLSEELDFVNESANLETLANNLAPYERLVVPRPVHDYTSSRVLTMSYISGLSVDRLGPLTTLELDGEALAEELFRAYLQQILVDGLFHADPHPGNVLLTPDHDLALIDVGMVGRLEPQLRQRLFGLLLAIADGEAQDAVDRTLEISGKRRDFDEPALRRRAGHLVTRHHGVELSELKVGEIVLELCRMAGETGVLIPPQMTLLGKTLLHLDEIGRLLAPDFDPAAAVKRHASQLMGQRVDSETSLGRVLAKLLEAKELMEELPSRLNRTLDLLAGNRLRVRVDAIDEEALLSTLQKIANRISAGLVLAALIVGASLMMRIDTSFKLFGYPGLAIICFLLAAAGGFWLVWTVLVSDRSDRRQADPSRH